MQVFRHMDIGTAKATVAERKRVVHHLIDIVDPNENYDAARYRDDALKSIRDIHGRGKIPLITGGTGLYLRALLNGIFPGVPADETIRQNLQQRLQVEGSSKLYEELRTIDCISAGKIEINDHHRLLRALEVFYISGIPWSEHLEEHRKMPPETVFTNILQIALTCERKELYSRINQRCQNMIDMGLEQEVKNLLQMGYDKSLKVFSSIGYRHIIKYLDGEWSLEEMLYYLARDTRRYAKRQYTWFSKMIDLRWVSVTESEGLFRDIDSWLSIYQGKVIT
jgi:tRNA dimethylallyltransferase